jgi:hypothetical protein
MNAERFEALLDGLGACSEAVGWAEGKSLAEVWTQCERADWMLWLCGKMAGEKGWPTRQEVVLVACFCAEGALPLFEKKYPDDARPRKAIEAARAWARGSGDIEELNKARRNAYAYAAAAAAADAYAAAAAAYAAAYAAYAAAYAVGARKSAHSQMCALIRERELLPTNEGRTA